MGYRISDKYYQKIEKRIEDKEFVRGNDCTLSKYYFNKDIHHFAYCERTPEVCVSLMAYSKCSLDDVPASSRTRDFYINAYFNWDVRNYIKDNIEKFDRQFFKDLIRTNDAATWSDRTCFKFMPLEYIDEEMCSLAILEATNYIAGNWFDAVVERKPEVLTSDLWNLSARLYSRDDKSFLNKTPKEFRTKDYYISMCQSNFNVGMPLYTNKGNIMDTIPKEVITKDFLMELLNESIENIAMFNNDALETLIPNIFLKDDSKEKLWKLAIRLDGSLIKNIPLNDERVDYFLSLYDKDSTEYRWSFKDNYKRYLKKKRNEISNNEARTNEYSVDTANRVIMDALLYSMEGIDPSKAIDDQIRRNKKIDTSLLPIKYQGVIPDELRKEYDSEEYLLLMYHSLGIKVIEEYDNYFFKVELPLNWKVETDGYWSKVIDDNNNKILEYFYDPKFYDKDAYVKELFVPSIHNETLKKILKQDNK